jgi:hypothetical protein
VRNKKRKNPESKTPEDFLDYPTIGFG